MLRSRGMLQIDVLPIIIGSLYKHFVLYHLSYDVVHVETIKNWLGFYDNCHFMVLSSIHALLFKSHSKTLESAASRI